MSEDYEFEDDAPVKDTKKKDAAPDFDPFADEDVSPGAESAPAPAPSKAAPSKKASGSDGGFDPFADGDVGSDDAGDADVKPGQGKDLWVCPHCGAKNKPNRDTCRACGKSPDEEVVIPLMSQTPVKIGVIAGAVIILLVIIMMATAKDFSLRSPGPASLSDALIHDDASQLAGSGRILRVSGSGDKRSVVVVFGYEVAKEFKELKGPNKNYEVSRGNFAIQPHVQLEISGAASLPAMKRGDYIAFTGFTDVESFADALVTSKFTVAADQMQFSVAAAE